MQTREELIETLAQVIRDTKAGIIDTSDARTIIQAAAVLLRAMGSGKVEESDDDTSEMDVNDRDLCQMLKTGQPLVKNHDV